MTTVTISGKGWVVIPANLRKKYGLVPGTQVTVVDYGGVLALTPQLERPIQQAAGLLRGDSSLTGALLAERRQEYAREQ